MKNLRHLLPLVILLFLFFGCRRQETIRIGVSQCSDDDWRRLMNDEIEREAMFHPELDVEIRSADDNSERQIRDIQYFIDNGFDIIIAAPNEADALTPVIKEAYEKGVPVLLFDRGIHGDTYTAFQGADNRAIGVEAARYAASLLPEGGKIIELRGLPTSTPAVERERGFHDGLDTLANNVEIIASVASDWGYDEAAAAADSLLRKFPDVDLIYAHNDRMAIGAADVAAKKKLHPYIIGIDAAPHIGMQAVAEGKLDATFLYPTEGEELIQTALAILEGRPFEKDRLMPVAPPVDRHNARLLLHQNEQLQEETDRMKALKTQMDAYWSQHSSQTALLYASIAILVLVCIVLFLFLRTYWQSKRHHAELLEKNRQLEEQRDLEKELNGQLAAATQSKLTFFTNVSHDLRTPLALITEPVDQVAGAPNLTDQQRVLMKIARKNVGILRRLINQILDFRKFENDKLDLHLEETHPAALAREWTEAFLALARKRYIDFKINIDVPDDFTMAVDVEKLERVVFNLLSNAFKYTPVKGTVEFRMALDGDSLKIVVADTGRGISAENLKNIFARFYQVDKIRPEGSGIGLSLAKAFVELHGGTISVESQETKGTEFSVILPVSHVANRADSSQIAISAQTARSVAELHDEVEEGWAAVVDEKSDKPFLLVIDDNADIRLMIRELVGDDYQVIQAPDGKEGIRLAARYVPDVIVCDVMMPGIDGMETCKAIKSEISTSHIPVLMLTACSLDEQRAEGYESGADGYMAKPFNSDVLRARLKSLIANRRRIVEVLGADVTKKVPASSPASDAPDAPASAVSARKDTEAEFYARFLAIVDAEMGKPALNVDTLAEKLGIGRSQFYRKIKALTNLSPVELLRDLRLKRARELLLTSDKTISEIAYEVGFSTPAYFTKCYREVYSETPSALRDRIGAKP